MWDLLFGGLFLTALYYGLIRGYLFRGIMWLFGYYGLAITLDRATFLHDAPLVAFSHPLPWSFLISFAITLAAILTTRFSKKKEIINVS